MKKNKTNQPKKKNIFVISISILLIFIVILVLILLNKLSFFRNNNTQYINNNTELNGINLSGLTPSEAYSKVNSYLDEKTQNFTLTLKYNDQIFTFDKNDYNINPDIASLISLANNKDIIHDSNIIDKETDSISFNYIFQGLDDKIETVCNLIETKPIDSTIIFNPDSDKLFEITPSSIGYMVDKDKLYKEINKQYLHTNTVLVDLTLVETPPAITEEYNQELTHLVSSFSTNVSDSTGGRKKNVNLALSKFNGMTIKPGETISFNQITGPHTLDNGYKIATIILKGQFVDGVGGGVCQASTTLYNALLLAGAEINEVHKHTLPVKYVPLALDAMVSEGIADLVFTNNTDYPMFIKTTNTANSVSVQIYSKPNKDGITYKTRSETIEELPAMKDKIVIDTNQEYTDKVVFKGETYRLSYARKGYSVNSYLQSWQNGNMIEEKLIRQEIYQPQPGIIIEGSLDPIQDIPVIEEEQISDTLSEDNKFLFDTNNSFS